MIPTSELEENGMVCPNCHSEDTLTTWNAKECNCPYCNYPISIKISDPNKEVIIDTRRHSAYDLERLNYYSNGESFTVGELLPWNKKIFARKGGFYWYHFSDNSFDLVMSLIAYSYDEECAILYDEFQFGYLASDHGPYLLFNFNNVISYAKHLNVWFLEEQDRIKWINSPGNKIRIFLLNGEDATLVGIREFETTKLNDIKALASFQLNKNALDIEAFFKTVVEQHSFEQLFAGSKSETIPSVENN